jgi:hypothetical protein
VQSLTGELEAEQRTNTGHEFFAVEWLGEKVVRTGFNALDAILRLI